MSPFLQLGRECRFAKRAVRNGFIKARELFSLFFLRDVAHASLFIVVDRQILRTDALSPRPHCRKIGVGQYFRVTL
jgi:hypothetical protein